MAAWLLWMILAAILVIAEMLTLTFYLLWFGVGALSGAIVAMIAPDALLTQVIVGCIVALILTVFTKPLTRRFRASRGFHDAIDQLVGKTGLVLEQVGSEDPGIVKIGNETWSALAPETIPVGERVVVVSRGSAVLQVTKQEG